MFIEAGAEAVNEGDCADVQARLVHIGRAKAVRLQALRNDPQKNPQHHIEHWPVALHEVTKPLWNREHPLAHRQAGKGVIRQMRRSLHHAPGVAGGADTPALAGEGNKVVVPAVTTAGTGKAVRKDTALQILLERFAHVGLGVVVIALAVELARAGQLQPGLVVLGYCLVEQRAFGVAWVVEVGFCSD